MRILFVCHRFPFPPNRGGKIRPFNIIRHLNANHEVTVASMVRSAKESDQGSGLADYCCRTVKARVTEGVQAMRTVGRLFTSTPSSMGYFYSPYLRKRIHQLLEETTYDLIFVHCSSVAPYVADVRNIPKILDFGDMDSQKWVQLAGFRPFPFKLGYLLEGRKLMSWEMRLARQFTLCTTTTRTEEDTLSSYRTGAPTDCVPNGVDAEFFAPTSEPYDDRMISFVGRMDYFPNRQCMVKFCTSVWPLLRERIPGIKLAIIGAEPAPEIRRLSRLPGVTVSGSVPDVRPLARKAAAMVAPLEIARGTQNKILESLAMGVPVVCSRLALRGVNAREGVDVLAADTPEEYLSALTLLLLDRERRSELAATGRAQVLEHHSWPASMRRMDQIIERCLTLHQPKHRQFDLA
jgi:sugar transferase (PEP-CTERM/EpsH1 system associated)